MICDRCKRPKAPTYRLDGGMLVEVCRAPTPNSEGTITDPYNATAECKAAAYDRAEARADAAERSAGALLSEIRRALGTMQTALQHEQRLCWSGRSSVGHSHDRMCRWREGMWILQEIHDAALSGSAPAGVWVAREVLEAAGRLFGSAPYPHWPDGPLAERCANGCVLGRVCRSADIGTVKRAAAQAERSGTP